MTPGFDLACYRTAVRQALPHATIVVDHFHLIALANKTLTAVRQRVTRQQRGRRVCAADPERANRRRLLRARENLTEQAFTRMWNALTDQEPTGQILTAWIAKEELRSLLACARQQQPRSVIFHRLFRFSTWCATSNIPELITLAQTIDAWWPETGLHHHRRHQRPHRRNQPPHQRCRPRGVWLPPPHQPTPTRTVGLHTSKRSTQRLG
ncbi:transposase [Nonomuraea guangzhouensis]|uniref:transposase n=1 Tax=Nonomuraea guangzhouensis TaxID=1291555 RepID=UPI001C5CEE51|nr:transposase [Nonomuraea guangzhouensis]